MSKPIMCLCAHIIIYQCTKLLNKSRASLYYVCQHRSVIMMSRCLHGLYHMWNIWICMQSLPCRSKPLWDCLDYSLLWKRNLPTSRMIFSPQSNYFHLFNCNFDKYHSNSPIVHTCSAWQHNRFRTESDVYKVQFVTYRCKSRTIFLFRFILYISVCVPSLRMI